MDFWQLIGQQICGGAVLQFYCTLNDKVNRDFERLLDIDAFKIILFDALADTF